MNLNAAIDSKVNLSGHESLDSRSARILDLDSLDAQNQSKGQPANRPNRILYFLAELRRRQVCRTITMYSIALWLVCQVVDVVSAPLALPDWTLRLVIVIGLIGFPIAMVLSWLFDINRDGFVANGPASNSGLVRRPLDRVIDCSLVALAIVIGAQLAASTLWAGAHEETVARQRIAVVPFQAASSGDSEALASGLVSELQHQLASVPETTVIFWREAGIDRSGFTLTGSVSAGSLPVRVIATLVDNRTDEITWTRAFEISPASGQLRPAEIARTIVESIPRNDSSPNRPEVGNE